ncbi:MAG TPA: NAD(P)/FAD-dependent oxidoreductase, partial [Myxococcaceae bacterium]|nr:NAD(P)/FAD-dependent oxidoreductase [Myxococcaceae bacterium]
MERPNVYDVIVIGGGHNGLVTAGLLAKRGKRVVLLERRPVVGGAAVTEQPWGPDFKMTSLSYVVSLMPPTVLQELELERFGYKVYPQHGYFVGYPDGRFLMMPDDPVRRRAQISKFSTRDADAMERWDGWLAGLGGLLGPMLSSIPPHFGSKSWGGLWEQARFAWGLRGMDEKQVADVTRLFAMSVADLLDEYFESPQMKGVLSVSGVIGTWAGPRSPGTAYVMAHHKIGDVGDGKMGAWGFPRGGMGGVTTAMRMAAEAFGAEIRTGAPVRQIQVEDGRVSGVVLDNGDEIRAPVVVTATHP